MKKIKNLNKGDQVYIKMPKDINDGLVSIVKVIKVVRTNGLAFFIGEFEKLDSYTMEITRRIFTMSDILDWQTVKYY
jgi:hypothetical protein